MLSGISRGFFTILFLWLAIVPLEGFGLNYTGGIQYFRFGEITYMQAGDNPVYLSEIAMAYRNGEFTSNTFPDLNLGIAKDNYWVRFVIQNQSKASKLYVVLQNPRLNDVEVFVMMKDSLISRFHLGDNFPFNGRDLGVVLGARPERLWRLRQARGRRRRRQNKSKKDDTHGIRPRYWSKYCTMCCVSRPMRSSASPYGSVMAFRKKLTTIGPDFA